MACTVMFMTSEKLLASNAALSDEVQRTQESLKIALLTIDKLKVELAYLRRMKYGRSSEQLEHAQLDLEGGQLALPADVPGDGQQDTSNVTSIEDGRKKRKAKQRIGRHFHVVRHVRPKLALPNVRINRRSIDVGGLGMTCS